jgi:uncharacterized protein YdhG (YjbR/CyaY superfamily)
MNTVNDYLAPLPAREREVQFAEELEPYEVKNTTIHFSVDNPLPAELVKRIVNARIAENEAA